MADRIPIIDLFAGPGGLGEGFSAYTDSLREHRFRIALSIEKDPYAHQTLELRSFFRQFDEPPDAYYDFLRGRITYPEMVRLHPKESANASREAWRAELGHPDF